MKISLLLVLITMTIAVQLRADHAAIAPENAINMPDLIDKLK